MKFYKLIIFILIVFFKTETIFSKNDLFNVNNIQLEKKDKISQNTLADQAIKTGFSQLIEKILLKDDSNKLSNLSFTTVKKLVSYYQITEISEEKNLTELVNFSVTFDKNKIHNLFHERGILYSVISDKELYILPLFIKDDEIYIFNNNFFYEKWNEIYENDLIEFILPLENIEIIQKINQNKNNLIDVDLKKLFNEYPNKNLALILIEDNNSSNKKIYIKTIIQEKKISKSLNYKKPDTGTNDSYKQIIIESKKELINLVKSKNLIDIRTPSFLNAKLDINKSSNLVELNLRIKNIDLIENIYVQEFNKNYVKLRIKYLGKLDKIINQLKKENIELQLINDQWIIKSI
tara:strand:- start:1294 stop:2340 length:1047 start_codon:yes stop_codon:yes gene_type:complete